MKNLIKPALAYDDNNGITLTLLSDIPARQSGQLYVTFKISAPNLPDTTWSFDLYDWRAIHQLGYYTPLRMVNKAYHAAMSAFIAMIEQRQKAEDEEIFSGRRQMAGTESSSSTTVYKAYYADGVIGKDGGDPSQFLPAKQTNAGGRQDIAILPRKPVKNICRSLADGSNCMVRPPPFAINTMSHANLRR